jgi:uncharacterized phage protein (TIGR01671 family)
MREILFRAKSCVGNWVYGYLKKQMVGDKADVWAIQTEIPESAKPMFIPPTSKQITYTTRLYENVVDPTTVGQFTGLLDKNGKQIFEGDIVRICLRNSIDPRADIVPPCNETVVYEEQSYGVIWGYRREFKRFNNFTEETTFEVIGNIHDNPDLIGGNE